MSLRRDVRKFLRAATRALNAYANGRPVAVVPSAGADGGKGADALDKALGGLDRDPVLAALDRGLTPRSYAPLLDEADAKPTAEKPG